MKIPTPKEIKENVDAVKEGVKEFKKIKDKNPERWKRFWKRVWIVFSCLLALYFFATFIPYMVGWIGVEVAPQKPVVAPLALGEDSRFYLAERNNIQQNMTYLMSWRVITTKDIRTEVLLDCYSLVPLGRAPDIVGYDAQKMIYFKAGDPQIISMVLDTLRASIGPNKCVGRLKTYDSDKNELIVHTEEYYVYVGSK